MRRLAARGVNKELSNFDDKLWTQNTFVEKHLKLHDIVDGRKVVRHRAPILATMSKAEYENDKERLYQAYLA